MDDSLLDALRLGSWRCLQERPTPRAVGAIAGLLPALRAARLSPTEALRTA